MNENGVRPELVALTEDAYRSILRELFDNGFFGEGKSFDEVLNERPDVGPKMRCAMPDFASNSSCRWPMLGVTHCPSRVALPGLTADQVRAAFLEAISGWNRVCGIRLELTDDYARANIYADSGKIDGRSGTLAWSYLPCGSSRTSRMQQLYDSAERWSYSWLVEVAAHEIGHAIGLSHGPKGSLMYAYSGGGSVKTPQAWDIEEARARYGLPEATPDPTIPDSDIDGLIVIAGTPYPLTDARVTIGSRTFRVKLEVQS